MRKPFQKLFFLLGVLLVASPIVALADEVTDDLDTPRMWRTKNLRVGAAKLRTSLANDPDTVWIGHIADPTWVPLDRNGNPVPSSARDANGNPTVAGTVPVGGHGAHHVGRGNNLPGGDVSANPDVLGGANTSFNGIWDFDHYQAGDDSLQGWWPVARPGQSEGAGNSDDKARAFFGLNYGNQGNYVMNMGTNKRTFGVTGYWHRDPGSGAPPAYVDGTPTVPGPNVEWAPIGGTQSAWCGLRAEADLNARDLASLGGTGNYYNSTLLSYNGNNSYNQTGAVDAQNGTDKNFPGVGSQWDQFLYRDVNLSGVGVGQTVTISFNYVHALSPVRGNTNPNNRTGYFWKDPVRPTKGAPLDGNFVSATESEAAGSFGPVDSFTVTLGQPVDIVPDDPPLVNGVPSPANDFAASSASGGTPNMNIYDPQRRWFSEVINTGGTGPAPMVQLLSRTRFSTALGGEVNPSTTPPATALFSTTLTRTAGGSLDALIASNGGRVRLVFRVVTNRGTDDEDYFVSGFTSSTRGAAIVDNVSITAGGPNLISNGDFENFASIDNSVNGVYSNLTEGNTTITSAIANAYASVSVGQTVTGQDISAGTTVAAKPNNSTITLSAPVRNTLDDQTAVGASGQRYVYFNMSTASQAWKSSGKPPGVYVHVHCINTNCASPGVWNDPCSPPNLLDSKAGNRLCNMVGNILSGGDHDFAEKPGGQFGANDQDRQRLAVSPTIIMATDQANANNYNAHGLNKDIVAAATEWALFFDIHTAGFRGAGVSGNLRSIGMQSYPARQANGAFGWGEANFSTAITFNTANTCNQNFISLKQAGFVKTSNASGVPDSIRVQFHYISRCYTTALTAITCSPTTGTFVGNYIDNLSFSVFNGAILAGLSNFPWMWYVDAFPSYESSIGVPKTVFTAAAFDTAHGKVKSAINRHVNTGTTARPSVPGDSAQVSSGAFTSFGRLDMVFRILPGPGNYTTAGNRLSAIKQVPTSATPAVGSTASSNFWENYMANTGSYGTGGSAPATLPVSATNINDEDPSPNPHDPDGAGPILPGTRWDWNAWNSARMDTLERNLWPALSASANLASNSGGLDWQSTIHELDPRFGTLGTAKNRCFLASPTGAATCKSRTPASTADCNVVCEDLPGAAPFDVWPPAWTVGAGYPASEGPGLGPGQTREFTKIIPDGQLTPGSHVQYFFRRFPGLNQAIDIWPDTTQIFDGPTADGGRWYNFSILPDRWKDAAYGGEGLLCMLVVDNFDRQGDEFFWVSAADSIGLTSSAKRGAQNGWFAAGGQNAAGQFNLATLRRDNGGQPGSMWDLWNTKAGESLTTGAGWLANRTAAGFAPGAWAEGKANTTGGYTELLQHFYRSIVWLTGTGTGYIYGSVADRGDDEIGLMNNFVAGATTRALLAWGSGFAENYTGAGGAPIPAGGGAGHLSTFWGTGLLANDYRTSSGNLAPISTYHENPGQPHDLAGAQSGLTYGMIDGCGIQNDILDDLPASAAGATLQTFHQDMGPGPFSPYGATVYVPSGGTGSAHPHYSHLDGTRINRAVTYPPTPPGPKKHFLYSVLKNVMITAGAVACAPLSSPVAVGDGPSTEVFANFLKLRSSNPMHSGEARLAFGLAKSEKVEVRVFDVTGRSVKTVANRIFAGGQEHVVVWDGTDEAGNRVKAGVYFYQLKTPTWTSQKKLAVLSN